MLVAVSGKSLLVHMSSSTHQETVLKRSPWQRMFGKDIDLGLLGGGEIGWSPWALDFVAASLRLSTDTLPHCFALLVIWMCALKVSISNRDPCPLLLILHVHQLCGENEAILWREGVT